MNEHELQDLYLRIFNSASVAMGLTDKDGRFLVVNKAWSDFLGWNTFDACQLNIRDITPDSDVQESDENYQKLINHEIPSIRKVKQYKRRDGKLFWADLHVSPVVDDDNRALGVLGIFVNIDSKVKKEQSQEDMFEVMEALNSEMLVVTNELSKKNKELETAYAELERLARHDPLTGLYNRRVLSEIMEREINRTKRSGRAFFVAIADIDNFKKINDTYGHDCGDKVLKEVANIFLTRERGIRETDYVGRWGGEEFLIVLTETHYTGCFTVLERIREEVQRAIVIHNGVEVRITLTIGFSYAQSYLHAEELIEEADKALYIGKNSGKNKIVCYFDEVIPSFG